MENTATVSTELRDLRRRSLESRCVRLPDADPAAREEEPEGRRLSVSEGSPGIGTKDYTSTYEASL